MPPKSKAAAPAGPEPEVVEEIVPEPARQSGPAVVTFMLDEDGMPAEEEEEEGYGDDDIGDDIDDEDDMEDDMGDEDIEEEDDALTTAVGQLTQLMMTDEGEAITDVLNGIRDSIEKQNKIMYRGLQLLEARFAKK